MTFTYRPAVEAEIKRGAGMLQVVASYAEAGAKLAQAVAPSRTRHYQHSIHASFGADALGVATGRVSSDDIAAHIVEFGSKNNPPYRPLTRGVAGAGLIVVDRGKRGG